MKVMNIKKNRCYLVLSILLFIFSVESNGKEFQSIEELIENELSSKAIKKPVLPLVKKPISIKKLIKNNTGEVIVSWETLLEFNLKKRSIGKNLSMILGQNISVKGFMIPLSYSRKKIKEFLLVPYIPSCAHVPSPAANMIINVKVKGNKNVNLSYGPVEVRGKLEISKLISKPNSPLPEGSFTLNTSFVKEVSR